jgi:hypothetical protein
MLSKKKCLSFLNKTTQLITNKVKIYLLIIIVNNIDSIELNKN